LLTGPFFERVTQPIGQVDEHNSNVLRHCGPSS
jgi:hypothetical protein